MAGKARDLSVLRRTLEATRLFMGLQHEINAPIIATFLGVTLWGEDERPDDPISVQELAQRVGLSDTTVSRHLRYLGTQRRINVPGLGLVETRTHPVDRRRKVVYLTRQGQALRDQLLAGTSS